MAQKFKNFQSKLKNIAMEDIDEMHPDDLFEDKQDLMKFHKNDGTEYNKKYKQTRHKPKLPVYDDGL